MYAGGRKVGRIVHVLGSRLVPRASDRDAIEAELRALKDDAMAMSTFMYVMALHAAEPMGAGGGGKTREKGGKGRGGEERSGTGALGLRWRKGSPSAADWASAGAAASTHAKGLGMDAPRLPSLPPDTIKLIGMFVAPVRPSP